MDITQLYDVYTDSLEASARKDPSHIPMDLKIVYAQQDFYAYLNEFLSDVRAFYALWIVGGTYTAALRIEPYMDGLLFSGLETSPKSRNRGYAKALIQAVCNDVPALKEACIYSHVDKANRASLAVHRACGFQRIMEHAKYIDGSVLQTSCTLVRYPQK